MNMPESVCGDVVVVRFPGEPPTPFDCLLPLGHEQWEHQHGNVRWTTKRTDMEPGR